MGSGVGIVGAGIVTALGVGLDQNWSALVNAKSGIETLTGFPADHYITDVAAAVSERSMNMIYEELGDDSLSRAYSMAIWAGQKALAERSINPEKISLILSTAKADFKEFEDTLNSGTQSSARRFNPGVMAREVADHLNLGGRAFAVSNACASGLIAIIQGARMLQRGSAEHLLVVGVDVLSDFVLKGFSCLQALSPRPARPFDEARDGLSLGEGAGAVLLSSVDAGEASRAMLRGWSATNDAVHITAPSREGAGLQSAISKALAMAGHNPETIGYINAHGTGTRFNDEMESHAVASVFGDMEQPFITSMKGNIGHTLGAAGVIETVLSLPVLEENIVPPSVGFETMGVPKELNVPREPVPFPAGKNILGMKSGFGGVNATLIFGSGEPS